MKEILPKLKDEDLLSYKTLVSWNMLGVVAREIRQGEGALDLELARLHEVLKRQPGTEALTAREKDELSAAMNRDLTEKIRTENIANENQEVWEHVKQAVKEKVSITNPRYSFE